MRRPIDRTEIEKHAKEDKYMSLNSWLKKMFEALYNVAVDKSKQVKYVLTINPARATFIFLTTLINVAPINIKTSSFSLCSPLSSIALDFSTV